MQSTRVRSKQLIINHVRSLLVSNWKRLRVILDRCLSISVDGTYHTLLCIHKVIITSRASCSVQNRVTAYVIMCRADPKQMTSYAGTHMKIDETILVPLAVLGVGLLCAIVTSLIRVLIVHVSRIAVKHCQSLHPPTVVPSICTYIGRVARVESSVAATYTCNLMIKVNFLFLFLFLFFSASAHSSWNKHATPEFEFPERARVLDLVPPFKCFGKDSLGKHRLKADSLFSISIFTLPEKRRLFFFFFFFPFFLFFFFLFCESSNSMQFHSHRLKN